MRFSSAVGDLAGRARIRSACAARNPWEEIELTRQELLAFLRLHRIAVQASSGPDRQPQAAVVGIAVTDALEIVFDTLESSRKARNLRADPSIALVVGWELATVQLQGVADFPTGEELERLKQAYFAVYPDGRDRLAWPGITHVRVRPSWVRYSDFSTEPPRIVELTAAELLKAPADS
jgi:hypothetical protein